MTTLPRPYGGSGLFSLSHLLGGSTMHYDYDFLGLKSVAERLIAEMEIVGQ